MAYWNESYVKPILSLKDIFVSQYIHYQVLNGRSIVHFILQLFDGILGKELCNIISSIIFGYLIYMVSCYITKKRNSLFSYSLITVMLFLLMPGFHNEFLLFSILVYERNKQNCNCTDPKVVEHTNKKQKFIVKSLSIHEDSVYP